MLNAENGGNGGQHQQSEVRLDLAAEVQHPSQFLTHKRDPAASLGPPAQADSAPNVIATVTPVPKSIYSNLSGATRLKQLQGSALSGSPRGRDSEDWILSGRTLGKQQQTDCVQVGSISYLRDTVNHQNKMQTRLDYEMMANPVELVGRRGEGQKARDSFVVEDSKDAPEKH